MQGICFVGLTLGEILCQAGQTDEGMITLKRSLEGFQQLGMVEMARQVKNIIVALTQADL